MRSRYSAFALGLGDYLVATLASEHEDRALPAVALARELSAVHTRQRFLGLTIFDAAASGTEGQVLFLARVFERGVDKSFVELSRFVRDGGAWAYVSGRLIERALLPKDLSTLTPEAAMALVDAYSPLDDDT